MDGTGTFRGERRGVALLTALAVLFVLTAMGAAYLSYMAMEVDKARIAMLRQRADHAAVAGVQAAIGELQRAMAGGSAEALASGDPIDFEPAVYTLEDGVIVPDETYAVQARVRISDESARLNLNAAPTSALRVVLGVDGEMARRVRAHIAGEAGLLTDVDDLLTRGLLSPEQFAALDRSVMTVHSGPGPDPLHARINLNTATPKVIEAALGVTAEMAEQVAAARPFAGIEEAAAAAGKPASTFNYVGETPESPPRALAFRSSAFRIESDAIAERGSRRATAHVEAVVAFTAAHEPVCTYWSELGRFEIGDDADAAPDAADPIARVQ